MTELGADSPEKSGLTQYNATRQDTSYFADVIKRYRRNAFGLLGLGLVVILVLVAVFAPLISPYDPYEPIPNLDGKIKKWQPPSTRHLLGTDSIGRDMLTRVIYGTRVSLSVGFVATMICSAVGTIVGSLAGYFGGWIDAILMRFTDTVLCFPVLFLLIALSASVDPSILNTMLIIGLVFWTRTARIVRGEFLRLRQMCFTEAAISVGVTPVRIILRHLLPNAVSPIIVDATLRVAYAILLEAALSFMGIGLQEPIPSWGKMMNQATSITTLNNRLWLWIPPGMAILITVLAINFVGDALRDAIDPKLKPA
jgi:peptide/nickel transport system permease protein